MTKTMILQNSTAPILGNNSGKTMKGITFSIHSLEPILATSFQGDPNSDVSYSYIPGSMIRGALISRYLKDRQISELDLNDDKAKGLFFDDTKTLFLNAYLLSREGKRTLPVPLSWFKDKDVELSDDSPEITVYDFSVEKNDKLESPKAVGYSFWTKERGTVNLYKEKRRINIHNFRDRKKGKGTKEQGEIFRYDALDAGQTFQGIILCSDKSLLEEMQKLLPEATKIWLGGSQSAGYGKTEISKIHLLLDDWSEVEIPQSKRINSNKLAVTLLSDAILRDNCGQAVADANLVKLAIEEALNITLPEPKSVVIYAGNTLVGGFNRKWGLPLPQLPALSAGSVVVFEGITLSLEAIERLEFYGIGERQNEGFGRVAVNWLNEEELQARKPDKTASSQPSIEESSHPIASLMATKIFRQRLQKQLLKKLGEGDTIIPRANLDNISNSQLSRLWLAAREGLIAGGFSAIQELLNPENLTKNARDQFHNTKMNNGDSLHSKVESWVNNPSSWMTNSQLQNLEVVIAANFQQGVNDEVGNQLVIEYTLRLIMAVAKRAIKEKE